VRPGAIAGSSNGCDTTSDRVGARDGASNLVSLILRLSEGSIEVDVATVDDDVLAGGVRGVRGREQKDGCCGDL